ncbi:hypothetical protein [Paractinoplanes atraurantiacus]|uniref:hypothetical protein n=1 Tax=Paractinoplanes atraurantiacus TaxID=1036182 RepID=UPI0015CF3C4A|nr:hypothetical protein [Actinoplanes atraurantiacus]
MTTIGFEVRCGQTVRGDFHAWSRTLAGGVPCRGDVVADAFGRLALDLCPDRAAPPSSR